MVEHLYFNKFWAFLVRKIILVVQLSMHEYVLFMYTTDNNIS